MHGSLPLVPPAAGASRRSLLAVSLGQCTRAGSGHINQDFHGSLIPDGSALFAKGIAIAIADGISSSPVADRASEIAVKSFLSDYYCTSDAWSVKTAAQRVIRATNSWLHAQNGRPLTDEDRDRGHVCTFSALILKSRTAHIFHIGDSRISRASGDVLEPLTEDHRVRLSSHETYLSRALGADRHVEIDYRSVPAQAGDMFVLTTDGVHEFVGAAETAQILKDHRDDLDAAARALVQRAVDRGSADDLTVQIVRVESVSDGSADELIEQGGALPPAPLLDAGQLFEGYEILRPIHGNSRSHIYLARDIASGEKVAIKVPSTELRDDDDHLRRLMLEEWIARRISNPHVLRAANVNRPRRHLFVVTEFLEGISLDQWIRDHPEPDLEGVRRIVEQVGRGLQAFHRREMLHQDLRPHNIIVDADGCAKIIDFGSTWVAGVAETGVTGPPDEMLGTIQYSAPEYMLGESGDERSDIFSLGVVAYQMLTGELPFGTRRLEQGDRRALRQLRYVPARQRNGAVPDWVDAAIAKAVHPDRSRRYELLSEFLYDLRHPNPRLSKPEQAPLLARSPELRWKVAAALLLAALIVLGWQNHRLSSALDASTARAAGPAR